MAILAMGRACYLWPDLLPHQEPVAVEESKAEALPDFKLRVKSSVHKFV